jgi:hypothetical protein
VPKIITVLLKTNAASHGRSPTEPVEWLAAESRRDRARAAVRNILVGGVATFNGRWRRMPSSRQHSPVPRDQKGTPWRREGGRGVLISLPLIAPNGQGESLSALAIADRSS